jgi:EmrB/QacA subfamily drug resistance transporter
MTATQRWTLLAAILGSAMVFLDGTIVNVALPRIGRELPSTLVSTLEGQTYVVGGYLATLAALLILAGALADHYGRRRVFALGLAGFAGASALCGLAPTLELLAVFRVLQGAAGALLVPGSLAVIAVCFEGEARARAFGIWAAATSAMIVAGPVLGGLLVDTVGWRAVFLINLPIAVAALWATVRHMVESRDEDASGRFDWLGALVGVLAVGGLAFGAIRGQDREWADPVAWASLGVGLVALVAFPILMARRPNPLVPLSLFRSRAFATINLSTLLIYGALYSILYLQSLFLQGVLGYTALAAGVSALPTGILLTLLSTRVGSMAGRVGARRFLTMGPLIMAGSLLWLSRVPSTSAPWRLSPDDPATFLPPVDLLIDVLPYTVLFGLGISLVVAPLTATLMASVPVGRGGVASAVNNALSRVGSPLLSAVIFVAITGTFYASLGRLVPGLDASDRTLRSLVQPLNRPEPGLPPEVVDAAIIASTGALQVAALVCAALLALGALANWIGLRDSRAAAAGTEERQAAEAADGAAGASDEAGAADATDTLRTG